MHVNRIEKRHGLGHAGLLGLLLLLFSCLVSTWGRAAWATTPDEIPPELRPWIPWVEAQLGSEVCASLHGQKQCQWPGLLELELRQNRGAFRLFVDIDASGLRQIPGGRGAWPQDVKVDGTNAPVLARHEHPVVLLPAGRHEISGTFSWPRLPETLEVAADTAFVRLEVDDKDVPLVKREGGKLWLKGLGSGEESPTEPEHVELSVFRRIIDGVPIEIETKLVFQVAGKARELTLKEPLLPSSVPLEVQADLALALEPSGDLRVQLLPGRHEVTLIARHLALSEPIENRPRSAPWPSEEIWTFQPDPELRSVELEGLAGIDASRTELPEEWRKLGAYVATADARLVLDTTRRGQEQIPDNQLRLQRQFWLDENAEGYTVQDRITGTMHRDFRLDLLSGDLGSVDVDGQSQVITQEQGHRGVEIRDTNLNVTAVSRVPRKGSLRAVGWSEDADSLDAQLHLPPGWDVLFAAGVDETSRTWLSRWDLFDVFYLLIVSLGMWKLCGLPGAIAACVSLLLLRGESGAPEYLWLPLLALLAVRGLVPLGRFRSWLSFAASTLGIITLVVMVAFSVDQVRKALYPHLDRHFDSPGNFEDFLPLPGTAPPAADAPVELQEEDLAALGGEAVPEAAPPPMPKRSQAMLKKEGGFGLGRSGGQGSAYDGSFAQKQFHPDAIVQTGPGIPEADGRSISLSWNGPVVKNHEFSLYLLSPMASRVLTVLRLVALFGFAFFLFRYARRTPTGFGPSASSASTAALVALSMAGALFPSVARADQPSDERLAQLKSRLTQAAECDPDCVSVSQMSIELDERLVIRAEVHAGSRSVYKLPGPATNLEGAQMKVNGAPATALRLEADGAFYLRLQPGVSTVEISATLPRDRVTLDVGTPPEEILLESRGWSVSGLNERRRAAGGTLTFQREVALTKESPDGDGTPESQIAVPPYFQVTRHLRLGVTGSVSTSITRISDAASPEVLSLPLLPGERLTTAGIVVEKGVAEISFPREEKQRELASTLVLPKDGKPIELTLEAPPVGQRSEVWVIECGVIYRCDLRGMTASSHQSNGRVVSVFHPFPSDQLSIVATEPAPAEGTSTTIHKATSTFTPGTRTGKGQLTFLIQTSRATTHTLSIPQGADLVSVRVGEVEQAVKAQDGKVRVALQPGTHKVLVEWKQNRGLSAWFETPRVDTGAPGVNFRTVLDLPAERWLLLAGGPSQGPALLFWGYLVLIALAAFLLPRLPLSPLRGHQWLLLGLGLTQVPAGIAVFVCGWFFAIAARNRITHLGRYRHNLLQLLLVGYTLAFLITLTVAVYQGLVSSPDMEVRGAGSTNDHLVWYRDRSDGKIPSAWAFSVNLWVWRAFMLAWALWLSKSVLAWLRWAWQELNTSSFWLNKPRSAVHPDGPNPSPTPGQSAVERTAVDETAVEQKTPPRDDDGT